MPSIFSHPSRASLCAFAISDTDRAPSRRVQQHLADCAACRAEVADVRELVDRSSQLEPADALAPDALARVLTARAQGRRVVLPSSPPSARPSRAVAWWPALAAAIVLALIATFVHPWSSRRLVAGESSGRLTFSNTRPAPGSTISVEYHAAPYLAANPSLVLRARYRNRRDAEYLATTHQTVATTLVRSGSDQFSGRLVLPADAVYAVFAVEDPAGKRVDANEGRLWEILVYDGERPLFAALTQKFNDLLDRSPDSALVIAQATTALYPTSPAAWASRTAFESYMLGPAHSESTVGANRARLASFDSALRAQPSPSVADMEGVASYAVQISSRDHPEVHATADYWRGRIAQDRSGSPLPGLQKISDLNSRVIRDSSLAAAALDTIERVWNRGDSLSPMAALFGYQIASRARDSAAVWRWVDRLVGQAPDRAVGMYAQIGVDPRQRPVAIARLRETVRHLETRDDARRRLDANVTDDIRQRGERERTALATLGGLLLESGDTTAATDALGRATADGWDVGLFARVARLYWSAHDTAHAVRAYAYVAADPATPQRVSDSISMALSTSIGAAKWERLRADADRELATRVLAGAVSRPPLPPVRVANEAGALTPIANLTHGKVAVLVFWSRYCGASRAQLPMFAQLQSDLTSRDVAFVPVTVESPTRELHDSMVSAGMKVPSFFDVSGEARAAFSNIATPVFYVLDARGRVRFSGNFPLLALTQAVAIKRGE